MTMSNVKSTAEVLKMLAGVVPRVPDLPPEGYYVYGLGALKNMPRTANKCATTSFFYIGKGVKYRAWTHFETASKYISKAIQGLPFTGHNHGLYEFMSRELLANRPIRVHIYEQGLSEEAAHELEIKLIASKGRLITRDGPLFNLADGGVGVGSEYAEARSKYLNGVSEVLTSVSDRKRPGKFQRYASSMAFGKFGSGAQR